MKIKLEKQEWYPIFAITGNDGREVVVADSTVKRWREAQRSFETMQQEMAGAYNEAKRKARAARAAAKRAIGTK